MEVKKVIIVGSGMCNEAGDSCWFPPLLLRRKVKAGHLGRKTGKGWYQYDKNGNKVLTKESIHAT